MQHKRVGSLFPKVLRCQRQTTKSIFEAFKAHFFHFPHQQVAIRPRWMRNTVWRHLFLLVRNAIFTLLSEFSFRFKLFKRHSSSNWRGCEWYTKRGKLLYGEGWRRNCVPYVTLLSTHSPVYCFAEHINPIFCFYHFKLFFPFVRFSCFSLHLSPLLGFFHNFFISFEPQKRETQKMDFGNLKNVNGTKELKWEKLN